MSLPFSRNQFDKLGKRLASAPEVTSDDLDLLEQAYETYDNALQVVSDELVRLGYSPTVRLKTTGTLIEKLRRSPGIAISSIHDIAGARIVVGDAVATGGSIVFPDGSTNSATERVRSGRLAQTVHTEAMRRHFANVGSKPPSVYDRRQPGQDSHGYRAVHIVAFVDRVPVEIQLRTTLQHLWAEVSERLADRWGRGVRYGEAPTDPDMLVTPGLSITRDELVAMLRELGDSISEYERLAQRLLESELRVAELPQHRRGDSDLAELLSETRDMAHASHTLLTDTMKAMLTVAQGEE